MAALTADSPRVFEHGHDYYLDEIPMAVSTKIFDGSAVGRNGGNARALVAGDSFGGFCYESADNSTGAAKARRVKVYKNGVVKVPVTGVTADTDVDSIVYASSDNDFTLTSTSNTPVGKINRVESGTVCLVRFESVAKRSI